MGGQRTERRKWLHLFYGKITAIIYCVSLADYDSLLREDIKTNRLRESVELFKETCKNPQFKDLWCFLLLNKLDLFEEKIKTKDPASYGFSDYTGGLNKDAAKRYFRKLFEAIHPDHTKLFIHDSVAVNSDSVKFVFENIRDVLTRNLIQTALPLEL